MSKTVSVALKAHYALETTTLCRLWQVVRADGTVMGFTDASHDVPYTDAVAGFSNAVTYKANTSMVPSAVRTGSDLAVDNLDAVGMLDSAGITDADLEAGKYDYAAVLELEMNYANASQGSMILRAGRMGEVTRHRDSFVTEVRGKMQFLQQIIGHVYSPSCDADLYDSRCKLVAATYVVANQSVTGVTSARVFAAAGCGSADHLFRYGKITWLTGDNAGLSMEVYDWLTFTMTLKLSMPYAIQVGDTFDAYRGCDKQLASAGGCSGFANVVNFRGFPYLPGTDRLLRYPDAH